MSASRHARSSRRAPPPAAGWPAATVVFGVCARRRRARASLLAVFGAAAGPARPERVQPRQRLRRPDRAAICSAIDGQGRDLLSRLLRRRADVDARGRSSSSPCAWSPAPRWRSSPPGAAAGSTPRSRRCMDILFAFPAILLAVLAAAVFGPGLTAPTLALGGRLHAVHRARAAQRRAARARARVHRAPARSRGCQRGRDLRPAPRAERRAADRRAGARCCSATRWSTSRRSPSSASACSRRHADWGVMVATGQSGVLQGYPRRVAVRPACASWSWWWPSTCSANDSPTRTRSDDDRHCTTCPRPRRCERFRARELSPGRAARGA